MQVEVLGPKAGRLMEVEEGELVVHQKEQASQAASAGVEILR